MDLIPLDGAEGEGGGQILRSSLALSILTGRPFRIYDIRANRPKPGLRRQHLTCVLAAAAISAATVTGAVVDSRDVTFAPKEVRGGDYRFDVGSAGFALCLPAAAALRRLPRWPAAIITAISTQSYSIYIVHLSVLEIVGAYRVRWQAPVWVAAGLSLGLIWALSWASWRWIEAPILARRPKQTPVRAREPEPLPLPTP